MSAAQGDAFYREVLACGEVWAIRDGDGFPAPESGGRRAMPFWSTQSRAQLVVDSVEAYRDFEVVSLPLDRWRSRWLPDLQKDRLRVGLNWSGARATGFDLDPEDVEGNLSRRAAL